MASGGVPGSYPNYGGTGAGGYQPFSSTMTPEEYARQPAYAPSAPPYDANSAAQLLLAAPVSQPQPVMIGQTPEASKTPGTLTTTGVLTEPSSQFQPMLVVQQPTQAVAPSPMLGITYAPPHYQQQPHQPHPPQQQQQPRVIVVGAPSSRGCCSMCCRLLNAVCDCICTIILTLIVVLLVIVGFIELMKYLEKYH